MYSIPPRIRRRLDATLLALAIFVILSWLLTGCVGAPARDPLGTPAKTQLERPFPPDFEVKSGIICRGISGRVDFSGAEGYGGGFRVLKVGEEDLKGCVKCDDGHFTYTSPGCENGEGL